MGVAEREDETLIVGWVESELGGSVDAIASQPRWRPHWFVDATIGGTARRLLVRGDRVDTELTFPLRHEMRFQGAGASRPWPDTIRRRRSARPAAEPGPPCRYLLCK
jgi:hypothetical protein